MTGPKPPIEWEVLGPQCSVQGLLSSLWPRSTQAWPNPRSNWSRWQKEKKVDSVIMEDVGGFPQDETRLQAQGAHGQTPKT